VVSAAETNVISENMEWMLPAVSGKTPTPTAPMPVRAKRIDRFNGRCERRRKYAPAIIMSPRRIIEALKMVAVG